MSVSSHGCIGHPLLTSFVVGVAWVARLSGAVRAHVQCAELCTGVNKFSATFPTRATPQQKMMILAATMGLDLAYFEKNKN